MSAGINEALAYINSTSPSRSAKPDLAAIAGRSPSAFSRSFRRHTGMALVQYVNRLRINLACQLLMSEAAVDHRDLLRLRLQQHLQFQPPVPGAEGHVAFALPGVAAQNRGPRSPPERGRDEGARPGALGEAPTGDPPAKDQPSSGGNMNGRIFGLTAATALAAVISASAAMAASGTVAFLMPDQASTRYEQHDYPGLRRRDERSSAPTARCSTRTPTPTRRSSSSSSTRSSRRAPRSIVLDPVDSTAAASLVKLAQSQGVKVIAYDRPIPTAPADFYVSFDNEGDRQGDRRVAGRASEGDEGRRERRRRAADQRLADRRGRRPDQEGHPRGPRQQRLPDPGRVRHAGMGAAEGAAVGERPDHALRSRRSSVSSPPTTAPAAAPIAAFKAAGVDPVPPVTGNDATIAALQLIIAGDQYNTISKPSEIVAAAAAKVAVQLLSGETPKAEMTLYDTPSQLFTPAVVTPENLKAEIIDKNIAQGRRRSAPVATPKAARSSASATDRSTAYRPAVSAAGRTILDSSEKACEHD